VKRALAWLLPAALMTGCIHAPVDEVGPSFETIKLIRSANFEPVALGTFSVSPGQTAYAKRINIRGSSMGPPKGADFAAFLKQTLESQLVAAGRYDASSPVSISAELTKNRAGENMSRGSAHIAATFSVMRGQEKRFSRSYEVENLWKSEFIGALAIPEAFRQYNELYGQLVHKLLADPEFTAALAR
jgi:hypothetical protein